MTAMGGKHEVRTVEVFRPGTFTPMSGQPVTFSAADLQALCSVYDPAGAPAPAVVGHPKTDDPAFGWASAFRFDESAQRVVADIGELEPAFAEAVASGRYKKISLSLFQPDSPNNPKPGSYYPKHIGFLGAAAPAVSGLKPVSFVGDDAGTVTFEFADASALRDVAGLFRSMRDFFIEKFGLEAADQALPSWTIGWIDDAADRDPRPASSDLGFTAPSPTPTPEPGMSTATAAIDAAALVEREKRLEARERAAAHAENLAFAEKLIGENRLLPAQKDRIVAILDALPAATAIVNAAQASVVSFAEGDVTKTAPVVDVLKEVLQAQPAVVSFGAADLGDADLGAIDFALPDGKAADPASAALHAKAIAFQAAHPGTEYMAAVAAVSR